VRQIPVEAVTLVLRIGLSTLLATSVFVRLSENVPIK
jgi:hypothetical protein